MKENKSEKNQELPPRPKTLKEVYELVVRTCPNANHSEEKFISSTITDMTKEGLKTRQMREGIKEDKMNFEIEKHWPLNDFKWASIAYLKNLNVDKNQINNLEKIFLSGFN